MFESHKEAASYQREYGELESGKNSGHLYPTWLNNPEQVCNPWKRTTVSVPRLSARREHPMSLLLPLHT